MKEMLYYKCPMAHKNTNSWVTTRAVNGAQ